MTPQKTHERWQKTRLLVVLVAARPGWDWPPVSAWEGTIMRSGQRCKVPPIGCRQSRWLEFRGQAIQKITCHLSTPERHSARDAPAMTVKGETEATGGSAGPSHAPTATQGHQGQAWQDTRSVYRSHYRHSVHPPPSPRWPTGHTSHCPPDPPPPLPGVEGRWGPVLRGSVSLPD